MKHKKVTWLELFYDLLFVAAVSKATHVLLHVEHGVITAEHLAKFMLIFIPIWWAWVGQSVYNNRFGEDSNKQRIFMILQLFFVLIMTASLNTDFNAYYLSFLIGYIGLRTLTIVQYLLTARVHTGHKRETAQFFGTYFWIGIVISCCSLFFDSWIRYFVLYAGIAVDVLVPLIGRRKLVITPIHTAHLLERFGLFTLILLGESVISMLAVLQSEAFTASTVGFAVMAFICVISIWWQYFEKLEHHMDETTETAGQTLMYGHLFIYFSLSMIAAALQLMFVGQMDYLFLVCFTFGSVLIYFLAVSFVFNRYSFSHRRTDYKVILGLGVMLCVLFGIDLLITVPVHLLLAEIMLFFVVFAKSTI
ncbi:low temperature requirement protein A [Paenibacillus donghaensis]|uniref:Low temperature requirement protein A n=1 Tax=Paenibacillus donghaensis TaxID=414771 RepID=A0A2Z2KBR2_9BACL|nr:low temperature requirement protein A [Paenibacillus donghaensis]ASA20430.1 low temperature requirement protein A [Paenibacillus donghaensis]